MSKKLTPWFPGNVKPVRKGVYQRIGPYGKLGWSKWDGEFWCFYALNFYLAQETGLASSYQDWKWRGLAEDPNLQA